MSHPLRPLSLLNFGEKNPGKSTKAPTVTLPDPGASVEDIPPVVQSSVAGRVKRATQFVTILPRDPDGEKPPVVDVGDII